MEGKSTTSGINAARAAASLFGVLTGLGGVIHGIGETLQGNIAPNGLWIKSWTVGPIATNMGGDPGLTIVPNLLLTGILTILVSSAIIGWAVSRIQTKHGGVVLILLSFVLVLVGGGIAPPTLGILAGVAGTGICAPYHWWQKHLPVFVRHILAAAWPWIFGICAINGLFLVIGSIILVFFFGLNNPDLFTGSFFFGIATALLAIFTGVAYDLQAREHGAVI